MKIILTEKQIKKIIRENIDEDLDYESFQNDDNLQDLRDAIDKNKMVSVAFVKKDGDVKHMLIRKNLSSYVGSDREKTDAQMNVEMNNDLKKVVDVNAYKREMKYIRTNTPEMDLDTIKQMASKKSWRTINLKNVLGFMVSGRFIDLRDENDIMGRYGQEIYSKLTKSMISTIQGETPNNDNLNESKKTKELKGEISSNVFDEFADTRMGGAEKIANTAKEKGGLSMLTYHHFIVKLPYYKKASQGKFNMEETKKEFDKTLKSISLSMTQTQFQTEVGRLEVLGELIIKHNNKGIKK